MKIKVLFFIIAVTNSILCYAQSKKVMVDPLVAKEHFSHRNYLFAMKCYSQLVTKEPKNTDYTYKLGLCYLYTNIDKKQAIKYLELVSKRGDADKEVWLHLGEAYHLSNRFDEAIRAYTKYKWMAKTKDQENAERQIEMCNNGKEFSKFPLKVTYENLGKTINSEFPDYYPFVTADESIVVFTSRRDANIGGAVEVDGYYSSDIYYSSVKNGSWTKAKNVGANLNTRYDEQAVSITADGKNMIVYIDHIDSLGNLYLSEENKKGFQKLKKLNDNVNSAFETSGAISADGNMIFFASERAGGFGGRDIYLSKKLPNGEWALPQNLGFAINTKYDEDFPRLSNDGKTLFFASQGHSSMGSFDVFKSVWDYEDNTWTTPQNIGYPINDGADNRVISPTKDEKVFYISAFREKGMGDLDIYRVTFNDAEKPYTVYYGYLLDGDTTNKTTQAIITATNTDTKEEFTYLPSPETGRYVMALVPGTYIISIEAKGFELLVETIEVYGKGSFKPEIKKDFTLLNSLTNNPHKK